MTMSRGRRARSLAFGSAFLALTFALEFIGIVVCGVLTDITHTPWLSIVASETVALLEWIFIMALAVVFYLDARNRIGLIQDTLVNRENSQSQ